MDGFGLQETTFTHCGAGETVLMKPTTIHTDAFSADVPSQMTTCGKDGCMCPQMQLPPEGSITRSHGRHSYIIGRNRSLSAIGRPFKAIDFKHYVPALMYADAARAMAEQEANQNYRRGHGTGNIWLSVCAGSHSDKLAAITAGYRYVPIDIERWVSTFRGFTANHAYDLASESLYDAAREILGEDDLLNIAVVSTCVPCETWSTLNPRKHRTADGAPNPGPSGEQARAADRIDANISDFLDRLDAHRKNHFASCTCAQLATSP